MNKYRILLFFAIILISANCFAEWASVSPSSVTIGETVTAYWGGFSHNVNVEVWKGNNIWVNDAATNRPGSGDWDLVTDGWETRSDYRVRILDRVNTSIYAFSGYFSVNPEPTITVTYPNGGQTWQMGETYNVTWSSSYVSGNVKIELYRYSSMVHQFEANTSNDGHQYVQVPTNISSSSGYRIAIAAVNGSCYDFSNNYFTINPEPSITVTYPNGGESWDMGETYNVTWSSSYVSGNVKIELYRYGSMVHQFEANTSNDGHQNVQVPTNISSSSYYRIAIAAVNGSCDDFSNNYFTINPQPSITVTYPNGGESWDMGETYNVTWSSSNVSGNVKIELYRYGSMIHQFEANTSNDGHQNVQVPTNISSSSYYRIAIAAVNGSCDDFSNNYFTINPEPSITVTYPNGGETWQWGETYNVTWSSINVSGNVKIELYLENTMVAQFEANTSNDGSQPIQLPTNGSSSSYYRIAIAAVNGSCSDFSDNYFTINPEPSITVTYPNGGESWDMGETYNVTWSSTNVSGNVKIELYQSGSMVHQFEANTSNDGNQDVQVPTDISSGANYRIAIAAVNGSADDFSNNYFTINSEPSIIVTYPNGGETWQWGETYNVTWTSTNVLGNVKIELYQDNTMIAQFEANTPNDGSQPIQLPSNGSSDSNYKIAVAAVNGSAFDFSDDFFSIEYNFNLISPALNEEVNSTEIYFEWSYVIADSFQLIVDNNPGFGSPEVSYDRALVFPYTQETSYTLCANWLSSNVYSWKVIAYFDDRTTLESETQTFIYEPTPYSEPIWTPVYRAYNYIPAEPAQDHFYCTRDSHLAEAVGNGYEFEKVEGFVSLHPFETGSTLLNIYRLTNIQEGSHIYTTNGVEKDNHLAEGTHWKYEGIIGYTFDNPDFLPMYELKLPNASEPKMTDYFYTTSEVEKQNAMDNNYDLEGIMCYVSLDGGLSTRPWNDRHPSVGVGINP